MSEFTGHAGFLGWGEESVWGTGVAASGWAGILSETLTMDQPIVVSPSIRGSAARRRYRVGGRKIAGDVVLEIPQEGIATLLYHLLGAEATAQVGATTAYDHVITPADTLPVGLSVEVNRGGAEASAFRYVGSRLNSLALEVAPNEINKGTFGVIAKDEEAAVLNPAYASSPTYDDVDPFMYHESQLKLDVYGGAPAEIECLGMTLNIANMLKEDKEKIGSNLIAALPRNAHREINGTFRMEYDDNTQYARYAAGTELHLQYVMTSNAEIESGYYYTITIDMPRCVLTGAPVNITGPELIEMEFSFEAFEDVSGSNPEITITVRDSDTSI